MHPDRLNTHRPVAPALDCPGRYAPANPLCRLFCAVRLRCLLDHEYLQRLEIIQTMLSPEPCCRTVQ